MTDRDFDQDPLNQDSSLFQNGPVVIFKWQHRESWPVDFVSRNVFDKLGYTDKEFTRGSVRYSDIVHPADLARVRAEVASNIQKQAEGFSHQPYRLLHKNGSIVWVDDHTVIVKDATGNITHFLGYLIDITVQKETEAALRRSEEHLNLALKGADLGIWDCEVQTGAAVFNQRWADILGYNSEEISPDVSSWRNLLHPEDKPRVLEVLNDHLAGRTPIYQSEHRIRTKTGDWLWVMDSGKIVEYDPQGLPLRAAGIMENIDTRKRAETALFHSNERFKTVLDSIDACIYVADMQSYEILFMNQNMIDAFGRDCTGELCWKVFRCEGQPCGNCTNSRLLDKDGQSTGVHIWQGVNEITGKNYINYDRAIHWETGRLARIQIATDITELKTLEDQLRQKYKMEAVGLLAGGVAHNFNNTLAIILGNIKLAQMKLPADSPAASYLENASLTVSRSATLVRQILAYSRTGVYNQQPIRLMTLVEETLDLLRAAIPTTVALQRNINSGALDLSISADPSQIQEILINLCTNAVHAMDEKGTLTVALDSIALQADDIPVQYERKSGTYARLRVEDTGSGMSPEILEKIFDPFFTTKEVNQGTGMGLATVQGIVDQHGGLIKVSSTQGEGSVFDLYFPVIPSPRAKESPQESPALPRGTEKILFLDDDEMLAAVGSQMLEEYGYQVTVETSSRNALEMFKEDPQLFDLVISDQSMPELSGENLLRAMFDVRPGLPAILCTGYSNKIDAEAASRLGIKAFFMKPLALPELLITIRNVLDGRAVT